MRGAISEADAQQIARVVARSSSVRWACTNAVTEWGGMLVAVGASGVDLRPDLLELRLGQVPVMLEGLPVSFDAATVIQTLSNPEIELVVDLHLGTASATILTCTAPVEY